MASFQRRTLQELCQHTKQACDALRPMIQVIYNSISSETAKLKADASAFTIADGVVQHLLINYLYAGGKFRDVIGEEDDCKVNITTKPYCVDDLVIPDMYEGVIDSARDRVIEISSAICKDSYTDLSVFIDPIDGTREFSTKLGEQCSVCIGFNSPDGLPAAGVVYRPITEPATWAAGAKSEGYADGLLDMASTPNFRGLLTSNGGISPFTVELMREFNLTRVPSGGAGNKMLMLLEGKGGYYIQDRGVSRWDTSGAQACLEARAGMLSKLSSFIDGDGENLVFESYKYLKSAVNLDFVAGKAALTLYNAADKSTVKKGETILGTDATQFKAYSNLCGLLAVNGNCMEKAQMQTLHQALKKSEAIIAPAYD